MCTFLRSIFIFPTIPRAGIFLYALTLSGYLATYCCIISQVRASGLSSHMYSVQSVCVCTNTDSIVSAI